MVHLSRNNFRGRVPTKGLPRAAWLTQTLDSSDEWDRLTLFGSATVSSCKPEVAGYGFSGAGRPPLVPQWLSNLHLLLVFIYLLYWGFPTVHTYFFVRSTEKYTRRLCWVRKRACFDVLFACPWCSRYAYMNFLLTRLVASRPWRGLKSVGADTESWGRPFSRACRSLSGWFPSVIINEVAIFKQKLLFP